MAPRIQKCRRRCSILLVIVREVASFDEPMKMHVARHIVDGGGVHIGSAFQRCWYDLGHSSVSTRHFLTRRDTIVRMGKRKKKKKMLARLTCIAVAFIAMIACISATNTLAEKRVTVEMGDESEM